MTGSLELIWGQAASASRLWGSSDLNVVRHCMSRGVVRDLGVCDRGEVTKEYCECVGWLMG